MGEEVGEETFEVPQFLSEHHCSGTWPARTPMNLPPCSALGGTRLEQYLQTDLQHGPTRRSANVSRHPTKL